MAYRLQLIWGGLGKEVSVLSYPTHTSLLLVPDPEGVEGLTGLDGNSNQEPGIGWHLPRLRYHAA